MRLLDILFPKYCINCRKVGSYLCDSCFSFLQFDEKGMCIPCGRPAFGGITHPLCQKRLTIDGAFAGYTYNSLVKKLVYQFKYKPFVTDLQELFIRLWYEALIQNEVFMKIAAEKPVLVPIPLHRSKERVRGYNQAELLAKGIAAKFTLATQTLLRRRKATQTQVGLSLEDRKANISDAFELVVKSDVPQTVFLIDDVLTTGATLSQAAKVLKQRGTQKVYGLTFARGQ